MGFEATGHSLRAGQLSPVFVGSVERFLKGKVDLPALLDGHALDCIGDVSFRLESPGSKERLSVSLTGKIVSAWHQIRWELHKVAMRAVVMASVTPEFIRRELDAHRQRCAEQLLAKKFAVLRVCLQDADGIKYDGVLSGKAMNIVAGRIVIRVGGIAEPYETTFASEAMTHDEAGFATLQINVAGVGRSQGTPTAETLKSAAKVALLFTEAVNRQWREKRGKERGKVVLKGFSLGAGAMAGAIAQHEFKREENDYLVMSINTFGRLSDVPGHYISQFVGHRFLKKVVRSVCFATKHFLRVIGADLDGVEAAKKLTELDVQHIIIQACHKVDDIIVPLDDGIISGDVSLLRQLQKKDLLKGKVIVQNCHMTAKVIKNQGTYKTRFIHCDIDKPMIRCFLENFRAS